jgi:predicted porin
MMQFKSTVVRLLWLAAFASQPVLAEPGVEISGFLSVVGGKVTSGSIQGPWPSNPEVTCPCYIADYANFGTYGPDFSLSPESRVGLQAVATLTDQLSATAQLTARGTENTPQLQWAYLTYALSPNWNFQAGRQRIPLYFYSSFQDVGMAYPWISPPPELYGWEATNYNGASVRNRTTLGETYVTASAFAGSERVTDNRFQLAYGQKHVHVQWDNIIGADVELTRGWLTLRAVAMRADTSFVDRDDAANDYSEDLTAYGLSANMDFNEWFILSEVATNRRLQKSGSTAGITYTSPAVSVGVGRRMGAWTAFLNVARYQSITSNESVAASFEFQRSSLTVKYELSPGSAIKAQIDHYREPGGAYAGTANVVRISYDRAF